MSDIDRIVREKLGAIYAKERDFYRDGANSDWYRGLLAHLQRASGNARWFREEMISVLAEHVRLFTKEFDVPRYDSDVVVNEKLDELEQNGFTYFMLPTDVIGSIMKVLDGHTLASKRGQFVIGCDPMSASATHYRTDRPNILGYPEFLKISLNRIIMKTIREHMGALPRLVHFGIYLNVSNKSGGISANYWHVDWSSMYSMTLFIYLNDVNKYNGPHGTIKGTHNLSNLQQLLSSYLGDSHAKIEELTNSLVWSDRDVNGAFHGREVWHTGPAGLAILEDTRGLHRAIPPVEGYRLMAIISWGLDASPIDQSPNPIRFDDIPDWLRPKDPISEQRFRYIYSGYLA